MARAVLQAWTDGKPCSKPAGTALRASRGSHHVRGQLHSAWLTCSAAAPHDSRSRTGLMHMVLQRTGVQRRHRHAACRNAVSSSCTVSGCAVSRSASPTGPAPQAGAHGWHGGASKHGALRAAIAVHQQLHVAQFAQLHGRFAQQRRGPRALALARRRVQRHARRAPAARKALMIVGAQHPSLVSITVQYLETQGRCTSDK